MQNSVKVIFKWENWDITSKGQSQDSNADLLDSKTWIINQYVVLCVWGLENGWVGGWMDRWMDGCMNGWTIDRYQTNGWKCIFFSHRDILSPIHSFMHSFTHSFIYSFNMYLLSVDLRATWKEGISFSHWYNKKFFFCALSTQHTKVGDKFTVKIESFCRFWPCSLFGETYDSYSHLAIPGSHRWFHTLPHLNLMNERPVKSSKQMTPFPFWVKWLIENHIANKWQNPRTQYF